MIGEEEKENQQPQSVILHSIDDLTFKNLKGSNLASVTANLSQKFSDGQNNQTFIDFGDS